jgi:hypothetical protein
MDPEERELQIKLAKLNADLQICLAYFFGFFAGSLAFGILGYELLSVHSSLATLIFILAIIFLCLNVAPLYKLNQCYKAFKNLR